VTDDAGEPRAGGPVAGQAGHPLPDGGRIAAIDYGSRRIGVALADLRCPVATPYTTYQRSTADRDADWFRRLVEDQSIRRFVVGLPVHLSGRESCMSGEAREFAQWLAGVTSRPVELFDERFSTTEATEQLALAGFRRRKRRQRVDQVAAQVLLAEYLESRHRPHSMAAGGEGTPHGPLEPLDDQPRQSE
jgi:putative Holliday junction resolvase